MTKDEFKPIAKRLRSAFARYHFMDNAFDFDTWYLSLRDIPDEMLAEAVFEYIMTQSNPPTIADIRKLAAKRANKDGEEIPLVSWNRVYKAICNSNYHAEEEFAKLTTLEQKAIGDASVLKDWAKMDVKSISVVQSQYISAYKAAQVQQSNNSALPQNFKAAWLGTAERPQLEVNND